jgi:2-C-methyl-D-erythritol 4-phosphate cytidylyltransferase
MAFDRYVIVVAGGAGLRMGRETPKQFLPLFGKPILMHTLLQFYHCDPEFKIILVLPDAQRPEWERLCRAHSFSVPHQVVLGGAERFHSVKEGLTLVPENALVAVHDGVRPFVRHEVILRAFEEAEKHGGAIPVLPLAESIRKMDGEESTALSRSEYRTVQTPQVFKSSELNKAYLQDFQPGFTDDASVYESAGYSIRLVEGNAENIKITTPTDLAIAEVLHQLLHP